MHRMSGVDAAFLYDERPDEPQHTLKISFWSAEASARHTLGATRRWLRSRLPELPPLRWRALRVPFDFHHPVWVDAGAPDLRHHVRRLAIPEPGGRRELCEVISEIASQQLDPDRPLWELWMLEGYEGGKVVAVLKMSHALADGIEARGMLERLYGEEPVGADEPLALHEVELPSERVPSRWQLFRDAAADRIHYARVTLPRLGRRTREVARLARAAQNEPPAYLGRRAKMLDSASTPFAGPLSRRRSFYFTDASLAEAKQIRRTLGCTINDVILATAAGAVRRYLRHHRALPGLPTLGHMAASIREEDERASWGNRITTRSITLPTHIDDPVERLRAASAIATEVKRDLALRKGANLEDWLRWLPPFAAKAMSRSARALVRARPELPCGVAVSNVPGPARTLHAPGGPVERFVSVGHMKYGAGVNITAWSYDGQLNFGFYACARAMPDLWRMAECLNESFEELRKAAALEAARVAA